MLVMAYRIVKETYKYDDTKYRVETNNGCFGLRKRFDKWKTVVVHDSYYGNYCAVFTSLKEAEEFIEEKLDHITSTQIIAVYN